jgi:AhpD family alkylhydroperoxidase
MMYDWNGYQEHLRMTIGAMARLSPDIVAGYTQISDAGAKTARLDAKTRELIALAVAVTRECDGCIAVHTDAAIKEGATREEVLEALGVAIAANAGTALVFAARAMDAYTVQAEAQGASA